MCQAAAETGIGLSEHLRRLKALRLADDNLLHVGGDNSRGAVAIDVIVAPGLKSLHERSLASIAERDDGQIAVLRVGMNDSGNLQGAHLPHVCRAKDCCWRIVFQGRQRESRLCAGDDLESFAFQRVAQTLRKIDVAVDQQNLGGTPGEDHGCSPIARCAAASPSLSSGPGVSASRFKTSMTSPSCESQPAT